MASKENLPRKSGRKHEQVSGRKNTPGGFGESWFVVKKYLLSCFVYFDLQS